MADPAERSVAERLPSTSSAARAIRAAGEVVLFALIAWAPWPFASNEPPFEAALAAGVLLLIGLWILHAILTERFVFRFDVVTIALLGMAGWSALQLIPLPEGLVAAISPQRIEWHRAMLPEHLEMLPGETDSPPRPSTLTLSVDPSATRIFLVRVLCLFLTYAAARNWLATRRSFRRLAWVAMATGTALAVFALAQHFTSPGNVVYWSVEVVGGVFGPFICRNHYPDFTGLCLGLIVGLLLPRSTPAGAEKSPPARNDSASAWLSPRGIGLAAAAGLIAASIAVSLSRGGILAGTIAALAAGLLSRAGAHRRPLGAGWLAIAAMVMIAAGLAGWLGSERIQARLSTLGTARAMDSRGPMWRDVIAVVPRFWATGAGDGAFVWVESSVKTNRPAVEYYENAHNEYLEALVEGGAVRFAFTLTLIFGLLIAVGRGYLERRERSIGPLLLGAWFGLAFGAIHSCVDFAIHMPAVALLTAVVAGFAMAAATDAEFLPNRGRNGDSGTPPRPAGVLRGFAAASAAMILAALAAFAAWDSLERERVHRLKLAADLTYWNKGDPERFDRRTEYLDARAVLRPHDPIVLFDAAQGHIDAAVAANLAGDPVTDHFAPAIVQRHIIPALRFLRAARQANPIAPKTHTRLALYADYFVHAEPAEVHFDRAKRLLATDPELWFASGNVLLRKGNPAAAWADWKQSLAISPVHLVQILDACRASLSPDEICDRVLPDDPVIVLGAANRLAPEHSADAESRRRFLLKVIAAANRPALTAEQLAALAMCHDELGNEADAADAWQRAAALAPDDVPIRNEFSRWLEREERYEEAIPHLEWLLEHNAPGAVQDRLEVARHGAKLNRGIGLK